MVSVAPRKKSTSLSSYQCNTYIFHNTIFHCSLCILCSNGSAHVEERVDSPSAKSVEEVEKPQVEEVPQVDTFEVQPPASPEPTPEPEPQGTYFARRFIHLIYFG